MRKRDNLCGKLCFVTGAFKEMTGAFKVFQTLDRPIYERLCGKMEGCIKAFN